MTRQDASADVPVAPATLLTHADTAGLGVLHIDHPDGAFGPSIATRIAVRCIGQHRDLLRGVGVDWGCGPGTLAIAAARIPDVTDVFGLDVNPINVAAAAVNAVVNGVSTKARFAVADSFSPVDEIAAARLAEHVGSLDFVVANPPASQGDDGFGYRRQVLAGALSFLRPGGVVFLNVSQQYGTRRIEELAAGDAYGFLGVLASSELVPFDLERPDLLESLRDYRMEEARGGTAYEFPTREGRPMTATQALAHFNATGLSPLTRWQVLGFERTPRSGV